MLFCFRSHFFTWNTSKSAKNQPILICPIGCAEQVSNVYSTLVLWMIYQWRRTWKPGATWPKRCCRWFSWQWWRIGRHVWGLWRLNFVQILAPKNPVVIWHKKWTNLRKFYTYRWRRTWKPGATWPKRCCQWFSRQRWRIGRHVWGLWPC